MHVLNLNEIDLSSLTKIKEIFFKINSQERVVKIKGDLENDLSPLISSLAYFPPQINTLIIEVDFVYPVQKDYKIIEESYYTTPSPANGFMSASRTRRYKQQV